MAEGANVQLVECELTVGEQGMEGLLIFLQCSVAANKFKHLLEDILDLFLDLIEDPLVEFA
jgi:hypothetical protein